MTIKFGTSTSISPRFHGKLRGDAPMVFSASIVCPTFNRALLLKECVQSILCDVNVSIEVIIVDDGSTDDTPRVCRELRGAFGAERIIVRRSDNNFGAQVARNHGLRTATAELVMFVDSDDVVVPDGIERLVKCLQADSTLDYAYGKVIRTDERLKALPGNSTVGAAFSNVPIEIAGYHWHTMGAMYQRSYLEKVGPWNEALTGSQDWEYQARVKLAGGRGEFVDTVVGYWRHHGGCRVGTRTFRPDYVRSVEKACLSLRDHAGAAGKLNVGLRRRLARKLFLHALEFSINDYPVDRGRLIGEAIELMEGAGADQYFLQLTRFMPKPLDFAVWHALRTTVKCRSILSKR